MMVRISLYPAWDETFFATFVDSNDQELCDALEHGTQWVWWTTSS